MALFRYPGGKVKLTKHILPALYRYRGFSTFVEPFTGGGSVALAMAAKYPGVRLILNDLDPDMFSFWQVVACGNEPEFESLVGKMAMRPTLERFQELQSTQPADRLDRAYRAMFFCRASHVAAIGKRPLGGGLRNLQAKSTVDATPSESSARCMKLGHFCMEGRPF